MTVPRSTVRSEARFEGLGLHSGTNVCVRVLPGDQGIWFREGAERVRAEPRNVSETTRCTCLGPISTIEHLMAALACAKVTDAEIEVTGGEMPALDGAARAFQEGLEEAGLETVGSLLVEGPFARVYLHEHPIKIAISSGTGHWRYEFDCGERWPGLQSFESADVARSFAEEIAPARTFAFAEEVPILIGRGLAKGLDLETALILGAEGYEGPARFPDEPARHKLLDCLGDLYLSGVPVSSLNVVAERSGHRTNVLAAGMLAESVTIVRESC